ncbi:MAG: maleate cis-trans isomerase [Parasphingorhabdus sp.]|jgi:maleate cis-trans isomerase
MNDYVKPERWAKPENKIFSYQVGFTSPPYDFDAAPSDFLRISPPSVGVHGRMLHVPGYVHQLSQRTSNYHLLDEFVECMANNGADVCGQVGTNWVHASGRTPDEIRDMCNRISDTYQTPFHMAGMCLVEGLRELGAERIAINSVYYWPDWRDGIARFLKEAGFDVVYYGNFVDLEMYPTQQDVNDLTWVFPADVANRSMQRIAELAPDIDAFVVNGMPNFRLEDGLTQRMVSREVELEKLVGKPIVSSDSALYWRIYKTLGIGPVTQQGRLLSTLKSH